MSLPLPQSKNHLLSVVDNLTYTQRFNYASRLGRDHKGKPALRNLVNDLLKHPDPPVPEMDTEEGFTEILPAQRTTIAKYYNEDQLALAIAVSAGMFDVIKERLTSPSTFFDHLVFSNYVRMKKEGMRVDSGKKAPVEYCASDDEIIAAILAAVPARRRLLIQESIQSKRLDVITKVVPQLKALPNYSATNVAHIIHACSTETVKDFLFENKFQNVGQVWNKIIKFHVVAVLELMEEDLEATKPLERGTVYNEYFRWAFEASKTIPRLLRNKQAMEKYLDIQLRFPILSPNGPRNEEPSSAPGKCDISVHAKLLEHFQRFMTALPEKTTQLMLSTVWLHYDGIVRTNTEIMKQAFKVHAGYSYINRYIKRVLEITPVKQKLFKNQHDYTLITEFHDNLQNTRWNSHQSLYITRLVADYMLKHKQEDFLQHRYHEWSSLWSTTAQRILQYFSSKLGAIYSLREEDKKQKQAHLKAQIEKYRKGVFETFELFHAVCFADVLRGIYTRDKDYEKRKINVTIDTYTTQVLNNIDDLRVTQFVFEKVRGMLLHLLTETNLKEKVYARNRFFNFLLRVLTIYKVSERRAFIPEEEELAKKAILDIFNFIDKHYADEITPEEIHSLFQQDQELTYKMFFPKLKADPLANTNILMQMYPKLTKEQQIEVYKWHTLDNLVHLVKNKPDVFISMVTTLPIEIINEAIMHMLTTPNLIDENTRNSLVSFQDINDIKIRNSLHKMSNSNNVAERNGALKSLIMATARSKDLAQLNRTLKFLREKIKNETMANRAEILQVVRDEGSLLLLPAGVGEAQFVFWNDMLTDALESPDLDNNVYDKSTFYSHPVLKFFVSFTDLAINQCVSDHGADFDPALFEFGVEMLWKLETFRHGEKKSAQEKFKIPFTAFNNNTKGTPAKEFQASSVPGLRKLLPIYIAAYEKRIAEKNPEWKETYAYFGEFFNSSILTWFEIPELVQVVHAIIAKTKAETNKDDDGLYIIPSDSDFKGIFQIVEATLDRHWDKSPSSEVIDLAMHSRLAPSFLQKWVGWKEKGAKKAREFKARKDKYIAELLQISPSAIHMRFVWRHLVTYMQNKLDDYVGKRKTFRGVFYVDPEKRKFDRSCLKTPETRRTGGRARTKPSGRGRRGTKAGGINRAVSDPQKQVDEEREKEKKIREELENTPEEFWDHEDFFYLEACFGLHRLLPRQVNVLAKDWEVQTLNADRAVPFRVKTTARWTLLPTITYHDIVVFLNANENPTEKQKGLPVNLIEALLRGVMRNDEPTAPLNFLLSPKFLGSDRSRVSVYAIAQSVPYMPQDGLTNMLKLCLTGKRRQQLKISSYKEIIRLLASTPTDDHLDTIFREWKRNDLHRDVRIAILVSAMKFLQSKDERFVKIAWRILEHGATLQDQHEILTALLGTKQEGVPPKFDVTGNNNMFKNSRILEHLTDLAKQTIPQRHAERFGKKVVAVIASTAKNDDVKFLAVGSLINWPILDLMLDLTQKYLMDFSLETLLYSDIPSERDIYDKRWKRLVIGFEAQAVGNGTPNGKKILELANALCNRIISMTAKERTQRIIVVSFVREMITYLPIPEFVSTCMYLDGEEEAILDVFKQKLYNICAEQVFERKQSQLAELTRTKKETKIDKHLALLHDITAYSCTYPTAADSFYMRVAANIIQGSPDRYGIMLKIFELKIDSTKSPISTTYDYLYWLRRAGLKAISDHKDVCNLFSEQTLKFWESVFDFAAERKDIPREHLKASQIFDFATLAKNIAETLKHGVKRSHYDPPEYPSGNAYVIKLITQRYVAVLKGQSGDSFAEKVGDYLLRQDSVITECAPEDLLRQICHNLILTTTEAFVLVPRIVSGLISAFKHAEGYEIGNAVMLRTLDKSKSDWGKFYVAQSRGLGLVMASTSTGFSRFKPDLTERFLAEVIPNLNNFDLHGKENTIQEKVKLVVATMDCTCGYNRAHDNLANDSARRFMNTYIPKYLSQEKPKQGSLGTPEEQANRGIVQKIITSFPLWIVTFHATKIPLLTDSFLQDASTYVIPKADVLKIFEGLGAKFVTGGFSDRFALPEGLLQYFSDIIHLHSRVDERPKNKVYIEISFDLAFVLFKQFPSITLQSQEETFYFVNWAISMYIREPDVVAVLQGLKAIVTSESVLPHIKHVTETEIADLIKFITTLIDLKHQKFVLPQQTLLPLQSYSQYTHVSHNIAFNMVRKFGGYLRETKEHEYVWRDDFVALLDRMCALADPSIKMEAWNTETVNPK